MARNLERRDFPSAKCLNSLGRKLCVVPQLHPRRNFFSILCAGDAHNLDFTDSRTRVEKLLDLSRVNVFASPDDHVFHAPSDAAVAILAHNSDVSSVQPAVAVDRATRHLLVMAIALHYA